MSRQALLLVLVLALLPATSLAGIVVPNDAPENPDRTPLTVVSQQVDVSITDQVATTTLVQVFRNDATVPLAGTYRLPLGERTSVQEYAFWVDGRRVVSRIESKEDAKQEFEGAERRGEDAALLEQRDPNTFTAKFTELQPGETRRFEVVTSELLPYEAGKVRYSHPLDYASTGLPPVDELLVRVTIADSKPIKAVTHQSFATTERRLPSGDLQVTTALFDEVPDRDFELEYQLESSDFGLAFRTWDDGADEGYFVAMVAPQEETDDGAIVRKDIAFVFDVSGSMSGHKVDQARSALKGCLNLMNPGDGLYLLAFNDSMNPFSNGVQELDEGLRREATSFVDGLGANGGTNIHDAMQTALNELAASERPTAIVFLTDGHGSRRPADVLKMVETNNPGDSTRIFTFGVGHDLNASFLERLGTENRGGYTQIDGSVPIDQVVASFYAGIAKPVLTDLALDFGPDIVANRTYPSVLPDVYKGQRLVITGRYRGAGPGTLTVKGLIGGEAKELALPVTFGGADQDSALNTAGVDLGNEHPWVGRLWAKRRAEHLLSQIRMYGETPEAKDEVISLSTQWQFATRYTSLVAHADPRVASLTPARIKPGDPVLKIPAPASSAAVTAMLPFGEVKDLVWDGQDQVWTTRFLVPRSVDDGVYWIHVVVTGEDGGTDWYRISYTVDTKAPVLRVQLQRDRVAAGSALAMTARPVIGFLELGSEMLQALGRDAAARAKAYVDIKSVVARIPSAGVETVLLSDRDSEAGWHGSLTLPDDLPPGSHRLEVTATDVAGNKHTVVERFDVLEAPVAMATRRDDEESDRD
ncbi:MAG: VWA domain-containing protein [Deltaproteobacteria bacterium]|nr:VWA domain-containing protein [Deltaproteobacteria bacterium]